MESADDPFHEDPFERKAERVNEKVSAAADDAAKSDEIASIRGVEARPFAFQVVRQP